MSNSNNFWGSVILLGKASIGKTSLLASIYHALREKDDFHLTKGEDLETIYKEMEKYVESLAEGEVKGNSPTNDIRDFTYTINIDKIEKGLDIIFWDIPGEYLRNNRKDDNNKKLNKVRKQFENSSIVIIVISAPSLMEKEGLYHQIFNQPAIISDFINNLPSADEIEESKEFILVPIKCEKYVENLSKLRKTIEKNYKNIIHDIVQKGHICSYLPVETLGSVKFDRFSELVAGDIDSLKEHYSLIDKNNTTICSKNADVLGAYILTKFIEPYRSKYESIVDSILGDKLKKLRALSKEVKILKKPDSIMPVKLKFNEPNKKQNNRNNGCLHSNTKILMFDKSEKLISQIQPGDKVLTLNKRGVIETQMVRKVVINDKVNFIKLCFDDKEEILATFNHLFSTDKGWVSASKMEVGCVVRSFGKDGKISSKILCQKIDNYCYDICYNIYITKNSNYFASGVLVSSISVLRTLRVLFERLRFYFNGEKL